MKHLFDAVAVVLIAPLLVIWHVARLGGNAMRESAFRTLSQLLSLTPGVPGDFLRRAFYRRTLPAVGDGFCLSFGSVLATSEVRIGHNVYIGAHCTIGHSTIGNDVLVGSGVMILGGQRQHAFRRRDIPIRLQGGTFEPITIGRDCWIGNGAIIGADIGDGSVVGAGAVVLEPVESLSIMRGNPAVRVGVREHRA